MQHRQLVVYLLIITRMKANIIMFVGASALVVAFVIGFALVRPVLAQVAATSTTAAASSTSVAATVPATASTTDTAIASSSPPSSSPADSSTTSTTPTPTSSDTAPGEQGKAHANGASASGNKTPIDAPPPGLTLVHIIGTKYVDYFTDGSTTIAVPGDPTVDGNLDKPNASTPTHAGMTWVHTTGQHLYDTPSGDLEIGDYAAQADSSYVQHAPPFVSSTSTPAQLPATETTAAGTSSSTTSLASPSVPDASTSSATAPSDSSATTTSAEATTSPTHGPRAAS